MGILDDLPKTQADLRTTVRVASGVVHRGLARAAMTEGQRRLVEMMADGLSLADIGGVTREERDAVLAMGCRQLKVGDLAGAEATLLELWRAEPSDERAVYALGATYQAQKRYEVAGRVYLQFIALNATNPQGFLRLGECFLANREPEGARGCFEAAKLLNHRGAPDPAVDIHAERMLALLGPEMPARKPTGDRA